MNSYKALKKQVYTNGEYSIEPIRMEDRHVIREWRNEQLYHLRQERPLTKEDQDKYFSTVVASLFQEEEPKQLLFSFLKNNECIGYGGLVHINWVDRNAEISFIMDTDLEKSDFKFHWALFLDLIEEVAFSQLHFHKLYTYAFDLRPLLYEVFESKGFFQEAVLKGQVLFNYEYIDVIIHSKFNKMKDVKEKTLFLREIESKDIDDDVMSWFDDEDLMKFYTNSKIKITKEKLLDSIEVGKKNKSLFTLGIFTITEQKLIGTLKLGPINYVHKTSDLVVLIGDRNFLGKGLAVEAIKLGNLWAFENLDLRKLYGGMYESNIPSIKSYTRAGWLVEGRLKGFYLVDGKAEDRVLVGCFNPKYFDPSYLEIIKEKQKLFIDI